jgi:hypothetical protein
MAPILMMDCWASRMAHRLGQQCIGSVNALQDTRKFRRGHCSFTPSHPLSDGVTILGMCHFKLAQRMVKSLTWMTGCMSR